MVTSGPVSPLTPDPTLFLPELVRSSVTTTALSEDERRIAAYMAARLGDQRQGMLISDLYYRGMQAITWLGISIPPELTTLRTVLGWVGTGIDALNERLDVQGFRFPDQQQADDELWDIWQANNLDAEHTLVHLDSTIFGTAYVVVGLDNDGDPVITTESPIDMTAYTDTRSRETTCAYQTYIDVDPASESFGRQRAALYTRDATIHLLNTEKGWVVLTRDDHKTGQVPVVPFPNRQRTGVRVGTSEILPSWRNTMDRSCRAAVRLEVTAELFSAPKMLLFGAKEKDFQNADGSAKTAWQTYIGRVLALEADENGNLPKVERFAAENPDGLIKLIDHETRVMSGLTALSPDYLGIHSDGNPTSADAIRLSDFRIKRRADRKAVAYGNAWEQVMRLALILRDGADNLPDGAKRLETDWAPTGIPTPAADTDAITKQIGAGMIPETSDVALAKVGWSAVERARIANDQKAAEGEARLRAALTKQAPPQQPPTGTEQTTTQPAPNAVIADGNEPAGTLVR